MGSITSPRPGEGVDQAPSRGCRQEQQEMGPEASGMRGCNVGPRGPSGDKLPMTQHQSMSLQTCLASISLQANPLFPGPVGPPERITQHFESWDWPGVCLLCFLQQCSALSYFSTGIFHVMSRSYFHRSYFHKISPCSKSTESRRICFLSLSKM